VRWRRRAPRVVDPRSPRPRLGADPIRGVEDPFSPRSVQRQALDQPPSPRLLFFGAFLVVAFGALTYNLFALQVTQSTRFAALSEGNRVRREEVLAPRGIIFDRHGVQLVQNQGAPRR